MVYIYNSVTWEEKTALFLLLKEHSQEMTTHSANIRKSENLENILQSFNKLKTINIQNKPTMEVSTLSS